jgi:hypothetical protein
VPHNSRPESRAAPLLNAGLVGWCSDQKWAAALSIASISGRPQSRALHTGDGCVATFSARGVSDLCDTGARGDRRIAAADRS